MTLEEVLSSVESTAQNVSSALSAADPVRLEQCSTQLRDAAVLLAQATEFYGSLAPDQTERVQVLASGLSRMRDQLARTMVFTGQRAATVLPPMDTHTYGAAPGPAPRIYHGST